MGWWKLKKHYGEENGKWCCRGGCGHTVDKRPGIDYDPSTVHGL